MAPPTNKLEWEEFVSGWGAGLFNVTLTYPIHKLMFRQMLANLPTRTAFAHLRHEGLPLLYRGLLPPLAQKTIASSIMFGSYHYYSNTISTHFPSMNLQLCKSAGAALAGATEAFLTPLERVQTVLQHSKYNKLLQNTAHAVRHIHSQHGVKEFYRGWSVILLRNSVTNVLFFGGRERVQLVWGEGGRGTSYIFDFVSGGLLGASLSSTFYPLNVAKSRMQCMLGGPHEPLFKTLSSLRRERGGSTLALYRGVHLNMLRSLISWGVINASYELIRCWLREL